MSDSVLVPRLPPIMKAATTNASHPTIAILRWRALQRPARAAKVLERTEVSPRVVECCTAHTVPTGRPRGDAAPRRRALGVVPWPCWGVPPHGRGLPPPRFRWWQVPGRGVGGAQRLAGRRAVAARSRLGRRPWADPPAVGNREEVP